MSELTKDLSLDTIIAAAITVPGVRVNRKAFLAECFPAESEIHDVLDLGPVAANISRERLRNIANSLIMKRTNESSAASFLAGLPGGLAMGVTIPADVLQYFGLTLRLAQELSYLYGAEDLWNNENIDMERISNNLILYCGVMFGASGASNGVRLLSAQLAKTAAKKIPQKALTKTFWYPIIKQIGKAVGVKVTKETFAGAVAKAVPVFGGFISGGITYASMKPMGKRLAETLDIANFAYTNEQMEEDIAFIEAVDENAEADIISERDNMKSWIDQKVAFVKKEIVIQNPFAKKEKTEDADEFEKIQKLAKLRDQGIITQEEYDAKKAELLLRI